MFFVSLIRAGNLVKFKSCLPLQIGVLCPDGEINNIHVMVVLKILWLSLAFSSQYYFVVFLIAALRVCPNSANDTTERSMEFYNW